MTHSTHCHLGKIKKKELNAKGEKKSFLFRLALEPSAVMTLGNGGRQSCVAENPLASLLLDRKETQRNGGFWYCEVSCTGGIRNNCLAFFFSGRVRESWQTLAWEKGMKTHSWMIFDWWHMLAVISVSFSPWTVIVFRTASLYLLFFPFSLKYKCIVSLFFLRWAGQFENEETILTGSVARVSPIAK